MLARLLAILLGTALACAIAETSFRFIGSGHGFGVSMASQIWARRCWRTDALGYREHPPAPASAARTIIVVGDSFTAGAGICDPHDRFGDQLAARRPDYRVFVVAVIGASTREEIARLRRFPVGPDVIVLGYFGNDIDEAAADAGYHLKPLHPYSDLAPALRALVTRSYALNYVYWLRHHPDLADWIEHYRRVWSDVRVVREHLKDLDEFMAFGVPVVVVIFPYLPDMDLSSPYVRIVGDQFRARGARVIDVGDLVRDVPASRRVVNPNDPHASVLVHHRVGAALAEVIPQ